MNIMRLIQEKARDNTARAAVTIAFLGDSVTQGCFEVYIKVDNKIETVYEREHAYHAYFNRLIGILYPNVSLNIINAGISGDSTQGGYERLERDVLRYSPVLVVVCFGLNDATAGKEGLDRYKGALRSIFTRLQETGTEIIFMTPNMMNTDISAHINDSDIKSIAEMTCKVQNAGIFDAYMEAAKEICRECDVVVCDCYAKWKLLHQNGVNVTELLANKINHPSREMNWLFAISLLETMLQEKNG